MAPLHITRASGRGVGAGVVDVVIDVSSKAGLFGAEPRAERVSDTRVGGVTTVARRAAVFDVGAWGADQVCDNCVRLGDVFVVRLGLVVRGGVAGVRNLGGVSNLVGGGRDVLLGDLVDCVVGGGGNVVLGDFMDGVVGGGGNVVLRDHVNGVVV